MATLTEEQFLERAGLAIPTPQTGLDVRNLPQTPTAEFLTPQAMAQADYQRQATEPGVPFDPSTGADALTRLSLGIHRNRMEQLRILRTMHGEQNIRLDPRGNFIVRTKDESGQPRDILVDEQGMSAKDLLDLTGEAPALALSLMTTKGVPVGSVFKGALRGAGGYAAGGAATDILARGGTSQPVDLPEILSERGTEGFYNVLFGYGLGKGIQSLGAISRLAKVAGSSLSDTTKSGALAEVEAGRQATSKRFGITLEPTVAEMTGSPFALRLESFLSNIPIARNIVLRNWQRQVENEKAIQNAFMGGKTADPEAVGASLINTLGREVSGAEAQVGKAADIVRRQTTEALTGPLEAIPGAPLSDFAFGTRTIRRGEAQLQSFKDRATEKYDLVKAQPDSDLPVFDTSPIKATANRFKQQELVGDQAGEPISALAPSGVLSILNAVDQLPANQNYFDLVRLRQSIYDRIDSPEPISGRGTFLLKKLGATITQELQAQGKTALSPQTQALIKDANSFYAQNVDTFYQKGIAELLKPRTEAGAVNPELIASRLLAGGKGSVTAYRTFREFFEKGGQVKDMNRLLRDHLIDAGTDKATGLVKLEDLSASVSKMEPELVQELFGKAKDKLLEDVRIGQKVLSPGTGPVPRGTHAAVASDEIKALLEGGKIDSYAIRKLADATDNLRLQYGNTIRKAVAKNDLGVIEAAPENFVREYLLNPKVPLKDVRDVMRSVYRQGDVDLIEDLRRVYLSNIFSDSAKVAKGDVGQLVARVKGTPLRELDPQALSIQLQEPAARARMEEILGHDQFDALKDFATAIGGRAQRDISGVMTGAFVGGGIFERMLSGLGGLSEVPKYVALSYLMTSPRTVNLLRNASRMTPLDVNKAVRSAILTPEFLRAVAHDSESPQQAQEIAKELQAWAGQQGMTEESFLERAGQPAR